MNRFRLWLMRKLGLLKFHHRNVTAGEWLNEALPEYRREKQDRAIASRMMLAIMLKSGRITKQEGNG